MKINALKQRLDDAINKYEEAKRNHTSLASNRCLTSRLRYADYYDRLRAEADANASANATHMKRDDTGVDVAPTSNASPKEPASSSKAHPLTALLNTVTLTVTSLRPKETLR